MSRGGMVKLHLALKIAICASARTAQNAELMPLRATYASIGGAFAPLWIAQDKGVFNKYGLAVDLRYMLSATGTQAAFVRQYGYRQSRHRAYRSRLGRVRVAFIIGICPRRRATSTWRQFIDESVIDEPEREGFFKKLR
jgi:hypothetical protein